MTERSEVIAALRRLKVQTGNLACLGCGHEHNCGIRGCAILRAAADLLKRDGAGLPPADEPLTIEQLREMDGKPVYVVSAIGERPEWYIVDLEERELKNPWDSISLENWDAGYPYTAYCRPPEGRGG